MNDVSTPEEQISEYGVNCKMRSSFIFNFFAYSHLPPHLQATSKRFFDLAAEIFTADKHNDETVMCLRKLLEAKDCAVRAAIK